MNDGIVIANFVNENTTKEIFGVWQYNYGQILRIQGLALPPAVEIHFSLQETGGTSITRIGITKDGVTEVPIPDSMLENGDVANDYSIYAFIYLTDETSGQTEYRITLKVKARPKPEVLGGQDEPTIAEIMKAINQIADGKADGLEYENNILKLLSGDRELARVTIQGGGGTDAREIELRKTETAIQWHYVGEETWKDLVQLEEITGKPGKDGITPHIGDNGNWYIGDTDTGKPSRGENATDEQVQQYVDTYMQNVDFDAKLETKLDKNQGAENAGKALVIGEDGNVIPGEVQGGTAGLDTTLTQPGKAADAKATGDKILQFAIKNTMHGENPLVVPDSAEGPVLGFGLTGKTEQATTKGSNLCDKSAFTLGVLGANGQVSPHTNMYVSDYIPVKSSAQYTRTILGDASNHFYDIDKQHITSITNTPFTVPENAAYCRIMATKNLFETNDLMFNEGTKILSYEPYTGGKPSPSPEYSQEIVSAGKWNEEKQKYEVDVKVTGKNLFDRGKAKDENNWIFKDGDGYARFQIHVKKGNKITFSYIEKLTTGMRFYLGISQSEISSVVAWLYHDTTVSRIVNKHTITATNDYIYLMCTKGAIQTFLDVIQSLQVEISPDQTEYQPYKEQTLTLTSDRSITKWDKLVEQDGQIGWQYSGKIITLTGNEEWISDLNAFYTRNYDIKNGNNPLCSHYVNKSIVNQEMDNIFSVGDGAYENSLWIRDTRFSTVQGFSAYLLEMAQKGTPITVIASSKTESPEFVPLPQEQQESIRALTTYYPTTVIGTDGGELNTDAELSYVADTKNFILGQIAEIAKKQLATDALILERTV